MDIIFIFGAKYLWVVSGILALVVFYSHADRAKILKFGIISLPLSLILAKVLNAIYYNPRPFVVEGFTPLIEHVADNGFPSDHVLLVSALAALITVFDKKLGTLLWFLAICVAISRVYVGVHHFIDVIGSMVISIIITTVIYFLSKNRRNAPINPPESQ